MPPPRPRRAHVGVPKGAFACGRVFGIPLYVHFSLPLFAIAALALQSWNLTAALGGVAGMFGFVLVHELGHAAFVRLFREHVVSITLYGWGGECAFTQGDLTNLQRATIAWGGVLAQLALAGIVWMLGRRYPLPLNDFLGRFAAVLVLPNVGVAVLNLVPKAPLDGALAWRLPVEIVRSLRARRAARRTLETLRHDGRRRR